MRSVYQFGGIADLFALEPTAGREALTTTSMQLLQTIMTGIDSHVSVWLGARAEADNNTSFMEWVRQTGRYDLCGQLRARLEPDGERMTLEFLAEKTARNPVLVYGGSDPAIVAAVATDDTRLVVLASQNPRRRCETEYLRLYCRTEPVDDAPTILASKPRDKWTLAERAVCFRVASILQADYFLTADVLIGKLSHGLPIVVSTDSSPVAVVLDVDGGTLATIRQLHETDYEAFGSMMKDFVRNLVFPRVADLVPSSTRQGADAFLKSIRRRRDVFEYEFGDLDNLSSLWQDYLDGRMSMTEAASRATEIVQRSVQVVDSSVARAVRDVVPDVAENEAAIHADWTTDPAPAILRTDIKSDAKLLTIAADEPPIKGFRCFIALSERAYEERGDFFLQPHSTSVVWGGQKVLFVFEHHSGQFGLYYDLQTPSPVSAVSGGGPVPTATIILRNRVFVPIPETVAAAFIPRSDERKRLEVRYDLLFTDAAPAGVDRNSSSS